MIHKPDFYRPLDIAYIDQLNEVIHDLSDSESYIRPHELGPIRRFRVMSVESSVAVMDRVNNDPEHITIKEMLSQSPADEQIAVVPYAIKFLPIGERLGKSRTPIELEARSQGFNKRKGEYRGIRGLSLELRTIKEDQFLPPEFKRTAKMLGATKFQDTPQTITFGWLDLATETEEMTRRRDIILNSFLTKIGGVLLEPIELGTI